MYKKIVIVILSEAKDLNHRLRQSPI